MEYSQPKSFHALILTIHESMREFSRRMVNDNLDHGLGSYANLDGAAISIIAAAQFHDRLLAYIPEQHESFHLLRAMLRQEANKILADVLAEIIRERGYRS